MDGLPSPIRGRSPPTSECKCEMSSTIRRGCDRWAKKGSDC